MITGLIPRPEKQGGGTVDNKQPVKESSLPFNPPQVPTVKTPVRGLRFDFNQGLRVLVPKGNYFIRFIDRDAALSVYESAASGVLASSAKRYFVNFRLEVYEMPGAGERKGDKAKTGGRKPKLVFAHDYKAEGRPVMIRFAGQEKSNVFAWVPYAEAFRKKHRCRLYVRLDDEYIDVLQKGYPKIRFLGADEKDPEDCYATYYVDLSAPEDNRLQPVDWRVVGIQAYCACLLGVDDGETRPRILPSDRAGENRPEGPYVCIAVQAGTQRGNWNNAQGWIDTVAYLKSLGYRVLCIDRERITENGLFGNTIPFGAEDFTGERPLQERVDLIAGARFFIGVACELSWLAWGTGVPVILITGATAPGTEFKTPYRVQQFHTCNSCVNEQRNEHINDASDACPHYHGADREFECTRCITPGSVRNVIGRLRSDLSV